MKNCNYCDDNESTCEECNTLICEECYSVVYPYEEDPFYSIYLCSKCAKKYAT